MCDLFFDGRLSKVSLPGRASGGLRVMRVTKRMRGRFKRKLLQMRRVKIKNLRRMFRGCSQMTSSPEGEGGGKPKDDE